MTFNIIRSPKTKFSDAQILLQELSGKSFSRSEAEVVWKKILNHKWNISEKLNRDVGFKVAAIDFIENFYQPQSQITKQEKTQQLTIDLPKLIKKYIRHYFEAKGNVISY